MNCILCQEDFQPTTTMGQLIFNRSQAKQLLCPACLKSFAYLNGSLCSGCGRQLADSIPNENPLLICSDCQLWQNQGYHLLGHQALYAYDEPLKEYMSRYKFMGDYRLATVFQKEMRQLLRRLVKKQQIDLVIPIPVSEERFLQRGFNQVDPWLLRSAKAVLEVVNHNKVDQSSLDRADRLNTPQPFVIAAKKTELVAGKRVLVVDDVYTTGRTLYHAADCLYQAGARFVTSASLAR
ncbi:DNA utilization protein ComFC/GntX [Fructobacillus evanidus]|uniref:ComF family protein n=1 Tax=Fructobacillus evanidus TaxID=3064281 RepID=UPI002DA52663|nr:DNA utilization protein ComFC/GntX [Fructobacillus sp. LMG 32999]